MRAALIIIMALFLASCTSTVSRNALLTSMEKRISQKSSHINILWYKGTKEHYHYLSHVYEMFGTSDYKILDTELILPTNEVIPLTSDSTKWTLISEIKNKWVASRKNHGTWEPDREGKIIAQ